MRVLVAYASADGSTAGVAHRIAQRLRERGHDVLDQPVSAADRPREFDAVVLGSAIHGRRWLDQATSFVRANRAGLRSRPLWTFSVGMPDALPRAFRTLARAEENGIASRLGELRPRGHRLFSGVVKPGQFGLPSRIFLRLAGVRYGDFRDWPAIDEFTSEIADQFDLPGHAVTWR